MFIQSKGGDDNDKDNDLSSKTQRPPKKKLYVNENWRDDYDEKAITSALDKMANVQPSSSSSVFDGLDLDADDREDGEYVDDDDGDDDGYDDDMDSRLAEAEDMHRRGKLMFNNELGGGSDVAMLEEEEEVR